ncbi:MAG: LamG domain-containing protein [Candidatus Altiarchaeia archaeon]
MHLNRKAQIFTWDIILATVIFLVVLGTILFLWTDTLEDIDSADTEYELTWLATAVSEQLARTPGYPVNWTHSPNLGNITVIGLADTRRIGNDTKTLDRVLDPDKVIYFINLTQDTPTDQSKYARLRNRVFGTGKYDFYVELSCLDKGVLDCFEGLHFDSIANANITCNASNTTFYISNYTLSTDSALAALWMMNQDEGTYLPDSSRNSNDGTIYGGQWVSGKYGNALAFDGNDYAEIPNSASLENITEHNYTLMAWYNPAGLPPSTPGHERHAIISKKGFHTQLTYNNDSTFRFETWNSSNAMIYVQSTDTYAPGQWYFVTGVVDVTSKNLSLYVNGQLAASTLYYGALRHYPSTTLFRIGLANSIGSNYDYAANGTIDNVKILSRALSSAEALHEYQNDKYCRFGESILMNDTSYQLYDSKTVTFRKARNETLFDDDTAFLEPTATLKVVVYRIE